MADLDILGLRQSNEYSMSNCCDSPNHPINGNGLDMEKIMTKDETAGYAITAAQGEEFFLRVMEAEKTMGPLSREERTTILASIGTPVTLGELVEQMAGKRVLIVKDKTNEKHD